MIARRWTGLRCAAGVLVLAASSAGAQKPQLSLEDAIRRAELAQPSVIQAQGTLRNADARMRSATGAFLPNLSLSTSAGESFSEGSRPDPVTGEIGTTGTSNRSVSAQVQSSVELFDGFRRFRERDAARANRTAADAGLINARFQQALTTTNQFFDVLAATQLVRVREASVRRAQQQLEVSIARLRAGAAIRPDSLRSVVTLGSAQLNLLTAQTQLASAEANLGRLIGIEGPAGAVDDSAFYVFRPVDTTGLREKALAQSPQVRAAEASLGTSRASLSVSRTAYFPTVNLSGSMSTNASRNNDYTFLQSRSVSLSLNWPIFNRFQREQSIANSISALETAEADAAETRRFIQASVTTRLAELDAARVRIGITRTSVLAATEDLRVQQERYRLGAATIVDVLTSQEALNQAEVDEVNARFDYLRAKVQIEALIGRQL